MFSISESGERAEAEGQEEAAVAPAASPPWQSPRRHAGWGGSSLSSSKREISQATTVYRGLSPSL